MAAVTHVLTFGTVCSLLVIFLAIYLRQTENDLQRKLNEVLSGLIAVEKQHVPEKPKVAVGYGACHDLLISATDFLDYDESIGAPEHFDDVNSIDELKKSFAYYFRHGAAAERYMSNSTLFDELVAAASTVPNSRYSLGGNAACIASRLFNEGCEVMLAATLTPQLQKSLPSGLKVVGKPTTRDDIHLILEYKAGDSWGPYSAPRANRFILHNDEHNPLVSSLEALEEELKNFSADLLVISGLQMMDNYPFAEGARERRLSRIQKQMARQPLSTRIHFEMASFAEPHLMHYLMDNVIPYADSLGMNEQELANLVSMYTHGNVSLVSDSNPRVATVLDEMRHLVKLVRTNRRVNAAGKSSRELTRLHVHTLAYQAVLTVKPSSWVKSNVAAAKASLTAHRHVCATNQIDVDKAMLIMDGSFLTSVRAGEGSRVTIEPHSPVPCWLEGGEDGAPQLELCVAPILVCTHSTQTAGGGDNVSAAALAMQL